MTAGEVPVNRQWTSRLRRAESWGKRAGPLTAAPTWARLWRVRAEPWISTAPASGRSRPRATLKAVDLPAPLRPSSP